MADPGERKQPARGRPGTWSAAVGIAFVAVIAIAALNAVGSRDSGSLGFESGTGEPIPQFAVPVALGPVEGDANVFQDDCRTPGLPCPPEDRRRTACRIPGDGVIRICDLFDRPLVISFWFTRGGDCETQQDIADRVARRFRGRANFLSLDIRDDRSTVRRLVRSHGWRIPVGHDRDGAVSNLLRVGGCPTFLYALPGGITYDSSIGRLDERRLGSKVQRLIRASRVAEGAR